MVRSCVKYVKITLGLYKYMKTIKLKKKEYVNEACETCGSIHLVLTENKGKWKTCQNCSKLSYKNNNK